MYLADSGTGRVDAFDFDPISGDINRRRTIVAIEEPGVAPDGLTVDEDGGIWVALWGGGAVRRYGPDGALLTTVPLPVDRPTSCAFGGPDRSTLFVTTARHGLDDCGLVPTATRRARVPHRGSTVQGRGVRPLPRTDHPVMKRDPMVRTRSDAVEREGVGSRESGKARPTTPRSKRSGPGNRVRCSPACCSRSGCRWCSAATSSSEPSTAPIFRRRRFLGRAEVSDLAWSTPSATPMSAKNWTAPNARRLAIHLNGADDPHPAEDGTALLDDDFICVR